MDDGGARFLSRQDLYGVAATAHLVVRTGETRTYRSALMRKGVVTTGALPINTVHTPDPISNPGREHRAQPAHGRPTNACGEALRPVALPGPDQTPFVAWKMKNQVMATYQLA